MAEKPLIWLGDSRDKIRGFPDAARQIAGFQLWRVQRGLEPNDWKPMPSVGLGVENGSIGVDLARTFLTGTDLLIENPTFFSFRVTF